MADLVRFSEMLRNIILEKSRAPSPFLLICPPRQPPTPAYSIRLKSCRVRMTGLAFETQPWVLKRTLGLSETSRCQAVLSPGCGEKDLILFSFRFVMQRRVNDTEQTEPFRGKIRSRCESIAHAGNGVHAQGMI